MSRFLTAAVVLCSLAGGSAGDDPPVVNPFAPRHEGREDALPGYVELSDNRVMIARPEGYDESRYELLFRTIEAGHHWPFFTLSPMPNRKTDSNNNRGVSTDYIGMNHG